jgi:hypothetical protein
MGQGLPHRGSAMDHDDVIGQLLSGMRGFLAESALVHAYAAATRLDREAEPRSVVVDFASSAARLRARGDIRTALKRRMRPTLRTC